jgi:hypothetical protein
VLRDIVLRQLLVDEVDYVNQQEEIHYK